MIIIPDLVAVFGSMKAVHALKEPSKEEKKVEIPKVTCPICYEEVIVDQMITLECEHRFCMDCLADYIKNQVDSAQVDRIVCPQGCGEEISWPIMKYCVTQETLDKYDKFKLRNLVPLDENEYYYYCSCEYGMILPKNQTTFNCP